MITGPQHTPTPWFLADKACDSSAPVIAMVGRVPISYCIEGAEDLRKAAYTATRQRYAEVTTDEINAKFIVAACNYHEQLANLLGRSLLEKNDTAWQREVNLVLTKLHKGA